MLMIKLLILPTLLIIIGLVFMGQMLPIYAGVYGAGAWSFDQDPAYVYLFSGLTILGGHSPTHIDHPGTPLQVLTAIIIYVRWVLFWIAGKESDGVISSVLSEPELYIESVSWVLLALNGWATFYLGRQIYKSTSNTSYALFCQSAPLAFAVVAPRIVYLEPEALLIFTSYCLLGVLAPFLFGLNDNNKSDKVSLPVGILCGFGVAVKLTFVPLLGLIFLLNGRKSQIRALQYAVVTWLVCILPIIGNMRGLLDWSLSLILHSGKHGTGGKNILDVDAIPKRVVDMFEIFPFFFIVAFALVFVGLPNISKTLARVINRASELCSFMGGRLRLWLVLTVISLGLWIICAKLVVPPIIESAYRGESWSFLNGMVQGQATHPLSEYLRDWGAITIPIMLGGLGFWLVVLVISSPLSWPFWSSNNFTKNNISVPSFINERDSYVSLVLLMICSLQTLLVLKHFGDGYMVPVLPLAFVGCVLVARQVCAIYSSTRLSMFLPMLLLGLGVLMAGNATSATYASLHNSRRSTDESNTLIQAEMKKHSDPVVIGTYGCKLAECALAYGVVYSRGLDREVSHVLANFMYYDLTLEFSTVSRGKKLSVFGVGWVDLDLVNEYTSKGREVLLLSRPWAHPGKFLNEFRLKPLIDTPHQSLYKITSVSTGIT